ncbi:MAG: hypothetical protein WD690_05820 [Vicinamibacterales bacterium]
MLVGGWLIAEDRDTPYDGSTETANPLRERTLIRVWLLTADVRITTKSGVQITAAFPDVTRSGAVTRAGGETLNFSENFSGVGDVSVVGWRRLPVRRGFNVTLNAGVSLPTGKAERPRFREELSDGSLVPMSRLQRGSGTFDPLLGISVNRVFTGVIPPGTRLFASAAARLPVSENEFGMRTGSSWEAGIGGARELRQAGFGHNIVGIVRLGWLHRAQDVFEGTPVLVGGGDWITIAPALAIAIGKFTAQAEVRIPLVRSLANRQLDASHAFQVGLVRSF